MISFVCVRPGAFIACKKHNKKGLCAAGMGQNHLDTEKKEKKFVNEKKERKKSRTK